MPSNTVSLRISAPEDGALEEVAQVVSFVSLLRAALEGSPTEVERAVLLQALASIEATHRNFGLPESMRETVPHEQIAAFMLWFNGRLEPQPISGGLCPSTAAGDGGRSGGVALPNHP
jgi:hypothetical protein